MMKNDESKGNAGTNRLLKAIMQTEAEIKKADKEKHAAERRMKQIKESKTYKAAGNLKKIPSKQRLKLEVAQLEEALREAEEALGEAHLALERAKLDEKTMNPVKLQRSVREMKDEAKILKYVEDAVSQKKQHDENYIQALTYAGRLFMNDPVEYRHAIYATLLEGMKVEDIPEFMMREAFEDPPLQINQAASFRASLNMRIRKAQLGGVLPEYTLDDKQNAYRFAGRLNVRCPWVDGATYTAETLPVQPMTVVKPIDGAGARGVYLIHGTDDIIDLKQSRRLRGAEALKRSMDEDCSSGRVGKDEWMLEELIMDGDSYAKDIKFYCFYGKVGLILEIERYPELKYCWWTREGKRTITGKYDNAPFKGEGVSEEEVALAEEISAEIPAPFIRIDFLRSDKGLVFGEFTPKPGNYDDFDEETDRLLGDFFLEAESRLMQDLYGLKEFDAFRSLNAR